MPPPRFGTRRRPERETYGTAAGILARTKLGRPLLPWQQLVCDVALEIDPATGLLAYTTVFVTVPRQSGKTTGLLFTVYVLRCTVWQVRQACIYTAQMRDSARRKFVKEFVPIMRAAPGFVEGQDFEVRMANGSEELAFSNGSYLTISATQADSGHGDTLDMPGLDEIFAHTDPDIDQGFTPPMATRPEPQKWLLSTAGHRRSTYLKTKRAAGRAAVVADTGSGIAHFEWSADWEPGQPEPDVTDRRLWWFIMPALGHTQTEKGIEAQLADLQAKGFRRAFYNLDDEEDDGEVSPISPDVWGRQQDRGARMVGRLCFGLAVAPDRSRSTIMAAGPRVGGGWLLDVVETRAGTTWVPARLAELRAANPDVAAVALDPGGPAGTLLADIEATGIPVIKMGPRDEGQATGSLLSHLEGTDGQPPDVWHMGHADLDDAVAGARTRKVGDLVVWDRSRSTSYVAPLEAGTLAFGGLFRLPDEPKDNTSVYEERGFVEW